MGALSLFLSTDAQLCVGNLAGHGLLAMSGLLSLFRCRRLSHASAGARADATSRDEPLFAPKGFHCPEWPTCGCPGGTVRADCPGLQAGAGA
jgi:hypothetical protein